MGSHELIKAKKIIHISMLERTCKKKIFDSIYALLATSETTTLCLPISQFLYFFSNGEILEFLLDDRLLKIRRLKRIHLVCEDKRSCTDFVKKWEEDFPNYKSDIPTTLLNKLSQNFTNKDEKVKNIEASNENITVRFYSLVGDIDEGFIMKILDLSGSQCNSIVTSG